MFEWNGKQVHYFSDREAVEEETVTPYIGKKDGNGKKIFEGDVVRLTFPLGYFDDGSTQDEEYLLVYWDELLSRFLCKSNQASDVLESDAFYLQDDGVAVEVIGNIYDNPELKNMFRGKV